MSKLMLSRRTMLRGAGIALGLPFLEAMLSKMPAQANTAVSPSRYLVMVGGIAGGPDEIGGTIGYPNAPFGLTIPEQAGTNYTLPPALTSLEAVKNDIAIVSGLSIGATGPASISELTLPAHANLTLTALTGTNIDLIGAQPSELYGYKFPKGESSDILLIPDLAGNTTHRSLALRVDTTFPPFAQQQISHKLAGGVIIPNPTSSSPQQLFQALFGGLALQRDVRLQVVDGVKGRADALMKRLGRADQQRFDRHLTEVRDLERRVAAMPPSFTGACTWPADPGPDPMGTPTYQGEKERAVAMADLLYMAFVCDLTRIAALHITMQAETKLNMKNITGVDLNLHGGIQHTNRSGNPAAWTNFASALGWHVGQFAYLVDKLRNTPDGTGTLLDRSAIVFVPDGGWSPSPPGGHQTGSHSSDNVMLLVGGRVGGLKPGQHLRADGLHPSSVIFTAMRAAGYTGAALGEVSTEIPGLRAP